jgi:CubicO group peptidase (beta-lactamase class C family)
MAKQMIPGLSLAIIRDGHVVKEATYGLASVELKAPVTLATSFDLASMTKVFTAAAIMRLVEEGRLGLDEPVARVLPRLPANWSAVTIRECLAHTSGLPDVFTDDINGTTVAGTLQGMFEALRKVPVQVPGERSVYNQTGYVLLGMLIEKTTGMKYEQYMENQFFKPLGLTGLRFGDAWAIIPARADLYTALAVTPNHLKLLVRDGQPVFLHRRILHYGAKFFPDYLAPAATLNGSIRDLVKWEIELSEGKVVNASSLSEMMTPYRLHDGKPGAFGLGFTTGTIGPYRTVSYEGGAATWRLSVPAKRVTVIVLTNLQGSSPGRIAADIAQLYVPELARVSAR